MEREPRNLHEFLSHKVDEETQQKMSLIRVRFMDLASYLEHHLPECRAKSLCFTELETASMRAIQALALSHGVVQELPLP